MKKRSKGRYRNSQETEINAVLLMSIGIIVLVISCALLTVTLTDGHGSFVSTPETISVHNEETSEEETNKQSDEQTEEDADEEQTEEESESENDKTELEGQIEVDVSIEYTSGEVSEETTTSEETEEIAESSLDENASDDASQQGVTRYIFVGDSRYVGMSVLAQADDIFIAEEGMGYYYMVEHEADIKAAIIPGSVLIIGMGVNDVKSNVTDLYIQKINEWAQTLGISVYYMLVNPVDEATEAQHSYDITNDEIDEFNAALKAGLVGVHIIDTNSYIKNEGFVTRDGVHYNTETYQKIYSYIRAQVLLTEQSA